MPKLRYGANKTIEERTVQIGETRRRIEEDNSFENIFRGFEKMPTVYLERFDISPYLNKMDTGPTNSVKDQKTGTIDPSFFFCSVKLNKDDLSKLKKSLQNQNWRTYTCKICKKVYPDEKKRQNHHDNKHLIIYGPLKPQKRVSFSDLVIVHEVTEYHKCRKCPKIFENYTALKLHMKTSHKKRKCYICHYCTKSFVDRSIFKVHIKLHCDVCGDLASNKSNYNEHRRYVCRVFKYHRCRVCDENYFNFMDLKDHSYEHLGTFFICDICKDQFDTKCAVSHHLAFLHSKERPKSLYEVRNLGSDRLYLCNFCEETCVEKETIEEHSRALADLSNRAMTGYKDYYFCDQCLRKFDKESEMLQHKWTHFLKIDEQNKSPSIDNGHGESIEIDDTDEENDNEKENIDDNAIEVEESNSTETDINDNGVILTLKDIQKFDLTKPLPPLKMPKIMLERVDANLNKIDENKIMNKDNGTEDSEDIDVVSYENVLYDINGLPVPLKKTNVGPKSKKSLESKHERNILYATNGLPIGETQQKGNMDSNLKHLLLSGTPFGETPKKAIVDPKSKKTLLSKHQCEHCNKYFSSGYCLRRHVTTVHGDIDSLRCYDCEETFVWPSLLQSHRCIRSHIPSELPFDDVRPEIHFENYDQSVQSIQSPAEIDGLNLNDDDYMDCVDFEVPAPICELTEYDLPFVPCQNGFTNANGMNKTVVPLQNGYKVVMQEVPIEF